MNRTPPRKCWLVGHRGALGHAPENTMSAFEAGLKMGADFVECDVHVSKDGKCVIMHDEAVERTTNGYGLIKNLSSSAINKLDAGSWFSKKFKNENVPFLSGLLTWAKGCVTSQGLPLGVVIEIKNEPVRYIGIEKNVIEEVIKNNMQDRVILISFDHGVVKRLKQINPGIPTGMLYSRPLENPLLRAEEIMADAVFPRRNMVTKKLAAQARAKGMILAAWTVDEPPEMRKLIKCGVNAITTNFPDRLNRCLAEPV